MSFFCVIYGSVPLISVRPQTAEDVRRRNCNQQNESQATEDVRRNYNQQNEYRDYVEEASYFWR